MLTTNAKHDSFPRYPNMLREWLKRRRYKITQLAAKTDIPIRTLQDYLVGDSAIPEDRLLLLAEALECQPADIVPALFVWNVPHQRNPFFTGRDEILQALHKHFENGDTTFRIIPQALCGLGGVGKTQIAVEYAYRHYDNYEAVFWIKADTRENVLNDFFALASLLELPEREAQDQHVCVAAVLRWLRTHGSWLLIFDNADDLPLLREFLPATFRGHVLITTRSQALGRLAQRLQVEAMTAETSVLFLLRRAAIIALDTPLEKATLESKEIALQIAHELGGLPLALDQAGAYVEDTAFPLEEYLHLYRAQKARLLQQRGGLVSDHPEPVATTWLLSFQQVEQADPLAAELLRFCAFLDPDAIPEALLQQGLQTRSDSENTPSISQYRLNDAIKILLRYSLIRRHPTTGALTIHRLVQEVLKEQMNEETQRRWAEVVIAATNSVFPKNVEVSAWFQCQLYIPHTQVCLTLRDTYNITLPETATLFNQAGYYLRERALYTEAELFYNKALKIREQILGVYHPDVAQVFHNLARLYFDLGQYAKCEIFNLQALAIREQTLEANDLSIAVSLNSLAFTYYVWGVKYDEAEKLFQRALTIFGEAIGIEHPQTSHCLSNLALLYATQGKYIEAEQHLLKVQKIREKYLGPMHLDTARILQNLAWLYIEQRKCEQYEDADRLLKRSLEIREKLLGAEHPQTTISLHHLALLYTIEGKYREAEELYLRVLEIRRKMMGKDNPKVLLTEKNYAELLRALERNEEAVQLEIHIKTVQNSEETFRIKPLML